MHYPDMTGMGSSSHPMMGAKTLGPFLEPYRHLLLAGPGFVSFGLAFAGGLLACTFCPFTIPTVLGLASIEGTGPADLPKKKGVMSAAFSIGMVGSLSILGLGAGQWGQWAQGISPFWSLALMVLAVGGAFWLLSHPRAPSSTMIYPTKVPGIGGALLGGIVFSFGTPLVGLLFLLMLAAATQKPFYALLLGLGFGLGRVLPFWIAGTLSGVYLPRVCPSTWIPRLRIAGAAVLLIVAGIYLWLSGLVT